MAEVPVAQTRREAFRWPIGSITAQHNAPKALAGARTAGTRFLLPPVASPATLGRKAGSAWIATHTEPLTGLALILPVLHEMGTANMNRVMNTVDADARVDT